jgi:outer membrane protein assembly factor BamB
MRSIAVITLAVVAAALDIPPATQYPTVPDVAAMQSRGAARALPRYDWPQWGRDDTHNAVSPERNVSLDFAFDVKDDDGKAKSGSKNIAWAAELGTRTVIPPVISDGLVWCGTNARPPDNDKVPSKEWDGGILMCFREADGQPLWRHRTPRIPRGTWVEDFSQSSLGSVPYIDGDRLWYMNNRNEVVCFDVAPLKAGTGEPRLVSRYDTRKELGVFAHKPLMSGGMAASVAGDKDRVYVVTHNGVDESHLRVPKPFAPSLICLDKKSGRLLWTDNSPRANIMHVQISSPLVCEVDGRAQVVMAQGDGWVRSFEAETGRLLWKCDLNPKDSVYELGASGTRNYIVATPVLYNDRIYVPLGEDVEHGAGVGALYCIDPTKDGDVSRELPDGPKKGKPNPNSGVVWYTPEKVPDDAPRIGVGPMKKRDLLRNRDFYFCRCFGSVTIHDGLLYAADIMGFVYCFDAGTGKLYWVDDTKQQISGQPLLVDGKVLVGNWSGDVFAYAHGKVMKRLAKIESENQIRTGFVYANRTLYVTSDKTLYAIRTPR